MSRKESKLNVKLHPGKRRKHGGYTFLRLSQLPSSRSYIESYLTAAREGLVRDLGDGKGEENLSAAEIILIDRLITKLGVVRCMEEYIRENSVMEGNELAPCLKDCYLAYNNSVRLDLQALGLKTKASEGIFSPPKLAEEVDKENKRKKR